MHELVNLLALAEDASVGDNPKATIGVTNLGDSLRPYVHASFLDPAAYPRLGTHQDRVQIRTVLGDKWAFCRIVGDPTDDPADLLHELIDALQENQR